MSDSRLHTLKLQNWDAAGITVRLSSNMTGKYETNILHKLLLLLPVRQIDNIC